MRLACTYFLSKKYESIFVIRRSCSILVRSRERICHPGKSNFSHVTGSLITAIIPLHVGKTCIHCSDFTVTKRKNISRFTSIYRFFILMVSDSSLEFLGAIRLTPIVWPPKINMTTRNNMCIKGFLVTSVYSIVKLLLTSIGIFIYSESVFYMQFFVSCSHSLKKSQ